MTSVLQSELEGGVVHLDATYHENIFKTLAYDPRDEKALFAPFMELLSHILDTFEYSNRGRKVHNTHNVDLIHKDVNRHGSVIASSKYKTSPNFMIMGSGPNFHSTASGIDSRPLSYSLCSSPVEIKTEKNQQETSNTNQVVYARQCFFEQHHRRFVYTVMLTEKKARLFIFDRSGVIRNIRFNIHENPEQFVRIILGFCSPDNEKIGFDTNVFWQDGKRHIRVNNHWESTGLGEQIYYVADGNEAIAFSRKSLRGRGTVCWNVCDATGRRLLIKDSWRSAGREVESKLLAEVAGVAGVGQTVAYQDDGADDIANFRHVENCDLSASLKHNRIFSRIVMEAYGRPLEYFESRRHLLCAFRDAVNGHRNLWRDKKILHRDISLNNILQGKKGANVGNRGILIDLDMAIRLEREIPLIGTFRTGTRAFQSINVLKSEEYGTKARPHDYLDDLESFFYVLAWILRFGVDSTFWRGFYVLAWICLTYTGPGQRLEVEPLMLTHWEDDLLVAAAIKKEFLMDPHLRLTPYFQCFTDLFSSLGNFLFAHVRRKEHASNNNLAKKSLMTLLLEGSDAEYNKFLKCVDEAIATLKPEDPRPITEIPLVSQPEPVTPPPSNYTHVTPVQAPITPLGTHGCGRKRRTDGPEDSPSASKRNKLSKNEESL